MITYIDSENRQNYTVLFDKASTKLGLKPIVEEVRNEETHEIEKHYFKRTYDQTTQAWITVPCALTEVDSATDSLLDGEGNPIKPISSLNEYFQHIRDLAGMAIGQGRSGSDPYFLRLPLDEPFFEINANTRGITVPGELSQIAVKGDKLAEIVFFKIDRYYDAVDLNTRHIYIEWELPDGTKGISRDFLRDTQSEKDKIIFGWAIGDELTKQVGAIKFAVRFVEWFDNMADDDQHNRRIELDTAKEDTQLLYSFSSLPATVSVVDSLNYSLFEDDEALAIYNSEITNENIGTIVLYLEDSDSDVADETAPELAAKPIFVEDLIRNARYPDAQPITGKPNESKINLKSDGKLELVVEANSEDGGQISYVFGRIEHTADEGTGIAATGARGLVAKIRFEPATNVFDDDEFNEAKTFYILDATGAYIVVDEAGARAELSDAEDEERDPQFFERVAYLEIMAPGHYYAIADNRVGGKKANSERSKYFYVPWAGKPIVDTPMEARFIPQEVEYSLDVDENFNEAALDNRGKTNVRVASEAVHNRIVAKLEPVVHVENDETKGLTYKWYKHSDNHLMDGGAVANAESYVRPDGLRDDEWAAQEAALLAEAGWQLIEGAEDSFLEVSDPGCYAVKIINDFNNDKTETNLLDAGACRVTGMPQIPTIDWNTFKEAAGQGTILDHIDVALNDIDYDEISYEWHKVTVPDSEHPEFTADLEEATLDDMLAPAAVLSFDAQGKASIPFRPILAGAYFLVVRSTLNGATVIYNAGEDPLVGTIQISA